MRIWIDLTNSPHVHFFSDMVVQLQREHDVLLTCRPLANTVDLLRQRGFEYHAIGRHYGANRWKKALGFMVRVAQLHAFLKRRQVDVAISHSSFYSPVVARWLGIRSIYLNDNEHALGNRISFLCASTIMVPECVSAEVVCRQWGNSKKLIQYPGVKEGIYLFRLEESFRQRGLHETRANEIFIRPEPRTAQYYRGAVDFLDDLIVRLKEKHRIVLMPRDERQAEHYRQAQFRGIVIPGVPLTLADMSARCSLFIGAGGTMTREAAVLGIPTISVYQGELLAVDRYLIRAGHMIHRAVLTADFVDSFLQTAERKPPSNDLLRKGADAAQLIKQVLLHGHRERGSQEVR